MNQLTIKNPSEISGIGLHRGNPAKLRIEPLGSNEGIVFVRKDLNMEIRLEPQNVVDTTLATVLGRDGATVSTIEHFLSALYAYGIDNLKVIVDGNEMPILDGSSFGFCMMLDEAQVIELNEPKKIIRIAKEVSVIDGDKFVKLTPNNDLSFLFTIHFKHPVIGRQKHEVIFSKQLYRDEIAKARTFGFMHEMEYLRSKGLALGGNLDNVIVLDENTILNPDGLRYKDEFVRHKILDALGDMALLGHNFVGRYESFAGSHKLNHELTKKLLASKECFAVELGRSEVKEFAKAYA